MRRALLVLAFFAPGLGCGSSDQTATGPLIRGRGGNANLQGGAKSGGTTSIGGAGSVTFGGQNGSSGAPSVNVGGTSAGAAGGATTSGGSGGAITTTAGAGGAVDDVPTGKGTIGYWCGPPASENTDARFDDIAKAGFTLVSNACDGATYTVDYDKQMLALAEARGLTAIVTDQRMLQAVSDAVAGKDVSSALDAVIADYTASKALAGYHLMDEPGASLFSGLGAVEAGLETKDPTRIGYVNMLPNYASTDQLGTPTYDAYVSSFTSTVAPAVLSWDFYPFLTTGDSHGFFQDMAVVRGSALGAHVPFWQFVQAISFNGHRATTAAEKRWVAMQSLAYGASGIWYFTYWTPPQTSEGFGDGIIDPAGNKTAQYDEVTAINASFTAISRYLVPATSIAVFHDGALDPGTAPRVPGSPVYLPSFTPFTVGVFARGDDRYALIANRDYTSTSDSDVVLSTSDALVLDITTGTFGPFATTPAPIGFKGHVSVAAGDAVLLRLKAPVADLPLGAEAMVGIVRSDAGELDVVDASFGDGVLGGAGWDQCPAGYSFGGHDFESNGFWFCARTDLLATPFYVGNVVSDAGALWKLEGGTATYVSPGGWDECPEGTSIGKRFDSNGFWLCH